MNGFLLFIGILGMLTFLALLAVAAWVGYHHLKDLLDSFERGHYR